MKIWLPQSIKRKVKQIYFYKKYKAIVYSEDVNINTVLGEGSKINQGVKIGKNVTIGKYSYVNYNSIIDKLELEIFVL